ncbi:hypothetical protein Hanom_Chr14g01310081 [Helianthus anomalus]
MVSHPSIRSFGHVNSIPAHICLGICTGTAENLSPVNNSCFPAKDMNVIFVVPTTYFQVIFESCRRIKINNLIMQKQRIIIMHYVRRV